MGLCPPHFSPITPQIVFHAISKNHSQGQAELQGLQTPAPPAWASAALGEMQAWGAENDSSPSSTCGGQSRTPAPVPTIQEETRIAEAGQRMPSSAVRTFIENGSLQTKYIYV